MLGCHDKDMVTAILLLCVPAHEEEYKSHNAENADDNGQTSEHCGSTEGRGEDCSKVIQAATADFTTILAASKE